MRTLLLFRHAKAESEDSADNDHSRKLTGRGRSDAESVGTRLKSLQAVPAAIISSTAARARSTAEIFAETIGFPGTIALRDDLYLAPPATYIEVLRGWPDDEESVMMVGHNPGIEDLLSKLLGEDRWMQTAALARLTVPWKSWSDASVAAGSTLIDLWRPPHD
jgi:phosphohistidine phosphatase